VDCRELIVQNASHQSSHSVGTQNSRPSPTTLASRYEIDQSLVKPEPTKIVIFDDVLTTGSHFKACKQLIEKAFPSVPVIGLFLARCVREDSD
jgi:predicted amidophosphoribosyltransferase